MTAPVSTPSDPLLDEAARMARELRARCEAPGAGAETEELLLGGYASALALEGARRQLRLQALALSERELRLAAQEHELRALLRTLRARMRRAPVPSDDEPASQRLH
jgi:hypothetical protein